MNSGANWWKSIPVRATAWPLPPPKSGRFTSPVPSSKRSRTCPKCCSASTKMAGKTSRKPPPSATPSRRPEIVLIEGEDEFGVKQRARELFQQWSGEAGGFDHEIIQGAAANG